MANTSLERPCCKEANAAKGWSRLTNQLQLSHQTIGKASQGSPNGLGGFGWERGGWGALAKGGLILGYLLSITKACELVVAVTPCLHFVASVCNVRVHQLCLHLVLPFMLQGRAEGM